MKVAISNDAFIRAIDAIPDPNASFMALYNIVDYTENPYLLKDESVGYAGWSVEFETERDATLFLLRFS
jgi:hypothetical protein